MFVADTDTHIRTHIAAAFQSEFRFMFLASASCREPLSVSYIAIHVEVPTYHAGLCRRKTTHTLAYTRKKNM